MWRSCDVHAGSNFHYVSDVTDTQRVTQFARIWVCCPLGGTMTPPPLQKTEHSACRHTSAVASLFWSSRNALRFWGCLQTLVHILTQRSRHNECRTDFILQEAIWNSQHVSSLKGHCSLRASCVGMSCLREAVRRTHSVSQMWIHSYIHT